MSIRSYLNNNPAVMTIAAIVLLLICLAVIYSSLGGGGQGTVSYVYFYNTATGEVFNASVDEVAPIDTAEGPGTGVRAIIYSCGGCSRSNWQVAYLQKFNEEGRQAVLNDPASVTQQGPNILVRATDANEDAWVPMYSSQGNEIIASITQICPSPDDLKVCLP